MTRTCLVNRPSRSLRPFWRRTASRRWHAAPYLSSSKIIKAILSCLTRAKPTRSHRNRLKSKWPSIRRMKSLVRTSKRSLAKTSISSWTRQASRTKTKYWLARSCCAARASKTRTSLQSSSTKFTTTRLKIQSKNSRIIISSYPLNWWMAAL